MARRNPLFGRLTSTYLFPQIAKRKEAFLKAHPEAKLISLGIGDTTLPLPPLAVQGLCDKAAALGTAKGYTGYGPPLGDPRLREAIATHFYRVPVGADEVIISDGSKCDIARLAILFGAEAKMALQEPAYPVYEEAALMMGQHPPIRLPCNPENGFFPDLSPAKEVDLLYFCSPNNPTGTAATRAQLEQLVAFAREHRVLIVYDAVYSLFIQDPDLPRSIYEIPGAREVAIELGSFSKMAGFTGVRLGWTVVPKELKFDDGTPLAQDWERLTSTLFNGACNVAQAGALPCASPEGLQEMERLARAYMENARILREALEELELPHYGGHHAPYLWVHFKKEDSWRVFDRLLEECHLVCTPGSGFGPSGQGFVRLSAFGERNQVEEAARRLLRLGKAGRV